MRTNLDLIDIFIIGISVLIVLEFAKTILMNNKACFLLLLRCYIRNQWYAASDSLLVFFTLRFRWLQCKYFAWICRELARICYTTLLLIYIRYRSIITSHLHAWTCVVPRQKLAWTTFPHGVEYTRLMCSTHVTRVDIPHAIYTCGFSMQCTCADMHVYLWHCYFMFELPVAITH